MYRTYSEEVSELEEAFSALISATQTRSKEKREDAVNWIQAILRMNNGGPYENALWTKYHQLLEDHYGQRQHNDDAIP